MNVYGSAIPPMPTPGSKAEAMLINVVNELVAHGFAQGEAALIVGENGREIERLLTENDARCWLVGSRVPNTEGGRVVVGCHDLDALAEAVVGHAVTWTIALHHIVASAVMDVAMSATGVGHA